MNILAIIVGMAIVTYIPRFLPMFAFDEQNIPKRIKQFLNYIPYAALGALIFPGGIQAIEGLPVLSLSGILVALVMVWWKENIILTVVSSVGFICLMMWLFGY